MHFSIDGLIEIALGVYALLVGFHRIPASKDPEKNIEWLTKYGLIIRIAGAFLLAYGLAQMFGVAR